MNGIHDLGGMHGLGLIPNEENKPYFHHKWECRVFPLLTLLFVGGYFNVDGSRRAIEHMDPAHYLEASYYEYWLYAFETLLLEKGTATADELWGGSIPAPCVPSTPVLTQNIVAMVASTDASARVNHGIVPRFKAGDRIRAKNISPTTHARLPRYVCGKIGRIETGHSVLIASDTTAHGLGEHSQHVYSASLAALELWGTPYSDNVYIDLWDDYLEEA